LEELASAKSTDWASIVAGRAVLLGNTISWFFKLEEQLDVATPKAGGAWKPEHD
jgi:hypothetical protein